MKRDIVINSNTIKKAQKEQAGTIELKFYKDIKNTMDKWEYRNIEQDQAVKITREAIFQVFTK